MKLRLATTLLLVVGLAVAALSVSATTTTRPALAATTWPISTYGNPRPTDNVILKWDEQLLSTIRAYPAQTGPTVTSRAIGVLHTATYDAWAAYDPTAKVTRPDGPAQQKSTLNNAANKTKAVSYAAYRTLMVAPPGVRAGLVEKIRREARHAADGLRTGSLSFLQAPIWRARTCARP